MVPGHRATLLVVDDEPAVRAAVCGAAASEAARCVQAGTGSDAISTAQREHPDLIVLDLGLPDQDGLDVCRRLREFTQAPIVVLSARHSEREKARLLDAGADDYVTKPFGTVEFQARIRAQLRRARLPHTPDAPVAVGPFSIDVERRTAVREGVAVHLSPTEWQLLRTLLANSGRTMTHQQLFRAVWGSSEGDPQQYLRVYMAHLRRKLEVDPYAPRHFVTEPGVGYRFEAESSHDP
jgi:two-component system, OmpR family, KDP operon response regulator KdpE